MFKQYQIPQAHFFINMASPISTNEHAQFPPKMELLSTALFMISDVVLLKSVKRHDNVVKACATIV